MQKISPRFRDHRIRFENSPLPKEREPTAHVARFVLAIKRNLCKIHLFIEGNIRRRTNRYNDFAFKIHHVLLCEQIKKPRILWKVLFSGHMIAATWRSRRAISCLCGGQQSNVLSHLLGSKLASSWARRRRRRISAIKIPLMSSQGRVKKPRGKWIKILSSRYFQIENIFFSTVVNHQ